MSSVRCKRILLLSETGLMGKIMTECVEKEVPRVTSCNDKVKNQTKQEFKALQVSQDVLMTLKTKLKSNITWRERGREENGKNNDIS